MDLTFPDRVTDRRVRSPAGLQWFQPQQHAYFERYNRTVRHEWLDQYIIESIEEV